MCAPSAPAAPDVKGAAEAQASSQRVNQYTPYGSLVYSPVPGGSTPGTQGGIGPKGAFSAMLPGTPGTTQWQSEFTLNPEAQKALDSQMRVSSGLGELTEGQFGNVQQQYSQPMDSTSVQDVADKAYAAQTSRLDPAWAQREDMERTRLANQGLVSGGEAYSNAMRDFGQQRNDAYQQANLGAIQTMPQTYQLESAMYNQPLNTLNALRTGAQVQNPQFGGLAQATPYMQAAQMQGQHNNNLFNADMGAYNNQVSGATALGAAYIASLSDRRLKSNIVRVGTHPLGIGIYAYDIFGRREIGVMAQEAMAVRPEAVMRHPSGYLMVNYGAL